MKTNVPHWNIEGYGIVPRNNAAWNSLLSLVVRREGRMIEILPDTMEIGEKAVAKFGLGSTAGMTAAQKRQHQETNVERVEDQPDTSV